MKRMSVSVWENSVIVKYKSLDSIFLSRGYQNMEHDLVA